MNVYDLFDLTDQVAIVTGGYTGIGRQMAEGLAEAGADLVICARNLDGCRQAAEEISSDTGVSTLALRCDVTSSDEVKSLVEETVGQFGRIDILVNNAGIAVGGLPEETDIEEDWESVLNVNLTGAFVCTKEVGKVMIGANRGKIINISSVMGFQTTELISAPAYVTSKGGVLALTRDIGVRWIKHNINVNAIAPGWFPTNMTNPVISEEEGKGLGDALLKSIPAGRFGDDDDLKGAVVLLSSRASDYMVGQVIVVDGGMLVRY